MRDQIAKLAEAQDIYNADFAQKNWMSALSENAFAVIAANTDFAAILAEFDCLSKIEAAAREVSLYAKAMQEAMRQVRSSAGRGESAMFAAQDRAVELQERYAASLDALAAALAPSTGKSEKPDG